jgi:hypothetical protein
VSRGRLTQRLFIQAAFSVLFPVLFLGRDGATWLLIGVTLAVGCVALAWYVGQRKPNQRMAVIGFEILALVVGVLGLVGGHYVPGSIVGAYTLLAVLMAGDRVVAPQTPPQSPPQVPPQPPQATAPVPVPTATVAVARNILPGK